MQTPRVIFVVQRGTQPSSVWGLRCLALLEQRRVRKATGETDVTVTGLVLSQRDVSVE